MSRKMLIATTLGVVSFFGTSTKASDVSIDGASKVVHFPIAPVSNEVVQYLMTDQTFETAQSRAANVTFSQPIDSDRSDDFSPEIHSIRSSPLVIHSAAPASPAELPLVPLPSPLLTGSAGLLGLGVIKLWKKLHKSALAQPIKLL